MSELEKLIEAAVGHNKVLTIDEENIGSGKTVLREFTAEVFTNLNERERTLREWFLEQKREG